MKKSFDDLDDLCINTIRTLAIDAVEKAKSGHPGMPMGDAAMTYVLWDRFLRHNPMDPEWEGRDRFILSAGHGSMLLYSLLHLTGYPLTKEDLMDFRQWDSKTPGHPEYDPELGIEMTTGPLGQGFATGVGMAMAERYKAERYNKPGFEPIKYNIYGVTSDGDLMEGISNEAASIAGHLGLGSIVYLYSDNRITIEGTTDISFSEDVGARFTALGWHILRVDGNDPEGVANAIEEGRIETAKPSLIIARTSIGYGSPGKQDDSSSHGSPLGADEVRLTKEALGWPLEPAFYIPDDALSHMRKAGDRGEKLQSEWNELVAGYAKEYPELSLELTRGGGEEIVTDELLTAIPSFTTDDGPVATRSVSGKVLNAVAPKSELILGGSADLAPSNNTWLKGMEVFTKEKAGRNIHFGVREHAMGAILNGMALGGRLIPYGGTFLVFSDYMKPAIRLAALMGLQVTYVFTHDSIGLGEDGPTHQPVEHLAALRAVPNLTVIRPADANETACAWKAALLNTSGPTALVLTRQKVPVLDVVKYPAVADGDALMKGAYVVAETERPLELIIIASGSELHPALEAFDELSSDGVGVRVVSMPSFELFEAQGEEYKESLLPREVTARVAVEAAASLGWGRYVGLGGSVIALDRFGASAPYETSFKKLGFTRENIVSHSRTLLNTGEPARGQLTGISS